MSKEKILILIDWYLPGYKAGGPIKSVSTLVAKLKDEYSFHIITTDRDMGDEQSYNSVELDKWIRLDEDTAIYYCSGKSLGFFRFLKLMRAVNPKAIYLNSFFSKYFSVFPLIYKRMGLLHKKIVLAPRGMLGKGALEIKKGKKMFFIRFCKIMGLHKGIAWHSTSDQETDEIKAVFGNDVTIKFAPNISSDPNQTIIKRVKQKEELKIVFLSRISEKKNLLYSLEVVLKLNLMSRIEFDIYGPIEDEAYWKKCESMIKSMKGNKIVSYKGVLKGTEIQQTLSKYHFYSCPRRMRIMVM